MKDTFQICSRTDIDSSYKLVICPVDFLDTKKEKNIIVAFKIYWGLSQKEKFSKALNSVGRFLTNKMVVCINPVTKEFDEKNHIYWQKLLKRSDVIRKYKCHG